MARFWSVIVEFLLTKISLPILPGPPFEVKYLKSFHALPNSANMVHSHIPEHLIVPLSHDSHLVPDYLSSVGTPLVPPSEKSQKPKRGREPIKSTEHPVVQAGLKVPRPDTEARITKDSGSDRPSPKVGVESEDPDQQQTPHKRQKLARQKAGYTTISSSSSSSSEDNVSLIQRREIKKKEREDKAAAEKAAAEKAAAEKVAAEKAAQEKAAHEKELARIEKEKAAKAQAEAREAKEREEKERLEKEQAEKETADKEREEREREEKEKMEFEAQQQEERLRKIAERNQRLRSTSFSIEVEPSPESSPRREKKESRKTHLPKKFKEQLARIDDSVKILLSNTANIQSSFVTSSEVTKLLDSIKTTQQSLDAHLKQHEDLMSKQNSLDSEMAEKFKKLVQDTTNWQTNL